jgi:hypothetical protein
MSNPLPTCPYEDAVEPAAAGGVLVNLTVAERLFIHANLGVVTRLCEDDTSDFPTRENPVLAHLLVSLEGISPADEIEFRMGNDSKTLTGLADLCRAVRLRLTPNMLLNPDETDELAAALSSMRFSLAWKLEMLDLDDSEQYALKLLESEDATERYLARGWLWTGMLIWMLCDAADQSFTA